MFHRIGWTFSLWGVLAASTAIIAASPPPSASEPVSLYLRPGVTLDGPVVTVGDVAAMEGGNLAYRQWLAALDLADLSPAAPHLKSRRNRSRFGCAWPAQRSFNCSAPSRRGPSRRSRRSLSRPPRSPLNRRRCGMVWRPCHNRSRSRPKVRC